MAYFSKFPTVVYNGVEMTDTTRVLYIPDSIKSNVSIWEEFDIIDGQTPDSIAFDYYEDSTLHWLVMLMNDIIDPFFDWVLTPKQLRRHVISNYGEANVDAVHHYELNGKVVINGTLDAIPISNYTYEERKSEKFRKIKLIRPEYIPQVEQEFNDQIQRLNNG